MISGEFIHKETSGTRERLPIAGVKPWPGFVYDFYALRNDNKRTKYSLCTILNLRNCYLYRPLAVYIFGELTPTELSLKYMYIGVREFQWFIFLFQKKEHAH